MQRKAVPQCAFVNEAKGRETHATDAVEAQRKAERKLRLHSAKGREKAAALGERQRQSCSHGRAALT